MSKSFIALSILSLSSIFLVTPVQEAIAYPAKSTTVPLPPNAGTQTMAATTTVSTAPDYPSRLIIPSLSLNDAIVGVGTEQNGDMSVPSGTTKDVGWYKFGTVPGTIGSAVLDAHVFAAFASLKYLSVGSSIYVETDSGKELHFVVQDIETYKLADVPADLLFNRADSARLNLITCAGNLTLDHSTYDHRLVVYATLVTS